MKRLDLRIWLLLLLNVCVRPEALLAAPSEEQISEELMSRTFRLKTYEDVFGTPRDSRWSRRKVYTGQIRMVYFDPQVDHTSATRGSSKAKNEVILINGKKKWKAKYFVSKKEFVVKHVNVSHNICVLKLEAKDKGGTRLNLKFDGLDDLDDLFNAIFFRDGDNTEAYEREVDELLIGTYIDSVIGLSGIKEEEKKQLLRDLQALCTRGYPEIEVHNEEVFACVRLPGITMSNRYHADKDKRILTSAETAMKDAKSLIQAAHPKSSYLHGYVFYWQSSYIVPFDEQEEVKENIRLMTSIPVFGSYEMGSLSVLETIEGSLLKVDGERYFLGPYDPENQSFHRVRARTTLICSNQTQPSWMSDKPSICLQLETFNWGPSLLPLGED